MIANPHSHPPVFRFAPSPNGRLHLGHAYSALFTAQEARKAGGRFLLRIEDIDRLRCRQELVDGIYEDLAWLGLEWELPVRRQSAHFDDYQEASDHLNRLGVLYRCAATRSEIRDAVDQSSHRADPDGSPIYPGLFRGKPVDDGVPFALRLDHVHAIQLAMHKAGGILTFQETGTGPDKETGLCQVRPELWGDVVIVRKDTPTSYNLSVVVDDALQGVTHITRGHDLFYATHIHRVLQVLLGLPEPVYIHHRLISNDVGRKLSKSNQDKSLKSLRDDGVSAQEIRNALGFPD